MNANRLLSVLGTALVLSGCAVGPDYKRPDVAVPETFRGAAPSSDKEASLAQKAWREAFPDPKLQSLIDEALNAGPDALLAMARMREYEALAGVSRAPLYPQASLSLNTSPIARQSGSTLSSSYTGGLGVSWEIDLWGRYRRAKEAAQADLLASEENLYAAQAALVAGVASNYYLIASLYETMQATERNAQNQEEVLRLIRRLSNAGISSAAEERQQESALGATQATLPTLRRQIAETENALALLLGRPPGGLSFESPPQLALPVAVPAGLPSRLLEQRPDIRQAEARMMSSNARVGEAKALFFPSLSLTGLLGGVSTDLSDLLGGRGNTIASIGPNVLQPLFAGGQIYYNREAAQARFEQSVISYRKTVLNALGEVANALTAYKTGEEVLEIQDRRVNSARESLRLAELRFRAGTTNLLEVLEAQRAVLSAETDQVRATYDRRQAWINLYLALGGGWQPMAPAGEK